MLLRAWVYGAGGVWRKKILAMERKTARVGTRTNEGDPSPSPIATGSGAVQVGSDPTRFRNASPLRYDRFPLRVRFLSSRIGSVVDSLLGRWRVWVSYCNTSAATLPSLRPGEFCRFAHARRHVAEARDFHLRARRGSGRDGGRFRG